MGPLRFYSRFPRFQGPVEADRPLAPALRYDQTVFPWDVDELQVVLTGVADLEAGVDGWLPAQEALRLAHFRYLP